MSAAEASDAPRRRSLRFRILLALAILLLAALFGLWLARVPIATGFIDRKLAAAGVPARYAIDDLGFGRQRLTNVVIGDPANPDLVADWIETVTDIGAEGPRLAGVRAGRVRLRGRLVDGRLALGAIDRLLPAPSGAPFALPAIDLSVADARMRLETPAGTIGLRLAGDGRLDDGFRGTLAATGERLRLGGCTVARPSAVVAVRIADRRPALAGPMRAAVVDCGAARAEAAMMRIDVALAPALDRWSGSARIATGPIGGDGAEAAGIAGTVSFRGDARRTEGRADLATTTARLPQAKAARVGFVGTWRIAGDRMLAAGNARADGVAVDPALRRQVAGYADAAAGTPAGPIAAAVAQAAARALADASITGELGLGVNDGRPLATLERIDARAASGAVVRFDGTLAIGDPAGVRVVGTATAGGGGLPAITATLRQPAAGAPVAGIATIAPYAAGGARLALAPVRFDTAGEATRIATQAELSGPLGDGRVERLRLPIAASARDGGLRVNPTCAPLSFDRLALAGLALAPARLTLCPLGGALLKVERGRIGGGARIAAPRLAGTLGGSPLTLAAAGASLRLGDAGFAIDGLAARLGRPERETRLDVAELTGRIAGGRVGGGFAGGAGRIGNVPLLLSAATGRWTLAGGVLDVAGDLAVADAASDPRFRPLAARGVTLRLADGAITAAGLLAEPAKGVKVADVTIRHDLSRGSGAAHLAVPGITFGDGFQPEELTRLTFGVVADVKGTIAGAGDIAWSPEGVTSTGAFRTAGLDLAAAFGPVTGIAGELRFTDLLNLESAPDQVATVASINPGVPVTDGRIVYRTLPGNRVAVRSGRWPFAGGELTLDPTLLDFSAEQQRRLTFRVAGMQAARFLQQFDFDNIDATGTFDGVLPMVFDAAGGRIEGGTLVARGGGGIAYVGELTEKALGLWGNMAFQALKSLDYRELSIEMNGPLAGEMITEVRFAGVSQGAGAKSNFLIRRLQRLPFVFNIRIQAPFRGLLDSVASFYDPQRLIQRNLPALIEQQNRRATPSIQPPASEPMP